MTKTHGFTLIELMITIVIAAILLTVTIPSFQAVIKNNRLTTAANDFVTTMALARSEAIKRGEPVDVESASGSADWSDGWNVATAGGTGLGIHDALNATVELDASGGADAFTYQPNGLVTSGTSVDLTLCDDRSGEQGRVIEVRPTGRVNVSDTTC